jgi:hypothetical protein
LTNSVQQLILSYWMSGRKSKTTPSGWISGNAVCCVHNGHSVDKRKRGGVILAGEGITYSCFNCGYKASWQPGRNISPKLRKLLTWLSVPDTDINQLALNVMKLNEGITIKNKILLMPEFLPVSLPENTVHLNTYSGPITEHLEQVLKYMQDRSLYLEDGDFYWNSSNAYRERLIIPFKYRGQTVGWTARHVGDGKPKYLSEQQPGFVFNLDQQTYNREYIIVTEGPIDALPIGASALLGSEIGPQQALLINQYRKQVILIPDRDPAGHRLIEPAIEQGWAVSMPDWADDVKDPGDAVNRYGRLYTLYSIISNAETSALKIRLRAKKWYGN